jgi:hypothetical protein
MGIQGVAKHVRYRVDYLSLVQDLYCINFCLYDILPSIYFSVPSRESF